MQLSVYKKFNGSTVRGKTRGYIGRKNKERPDKKSRNQRLGES